MNLLDIIENEDITANMAWIDSLCKSDSPAEAIQRHIKNMISTNSALQTSTFVNRLWETFIKASSASNNKRMLLWCAKRLFSLQNKSASFFCLYQLAVCLSTESLPVYSSYNTSSEAHCILRAQFSKYITTSGILDLINRQLEILVQGQGLFQDREAAIFRTMIMFLQRCVGVLNGTMMFLEPCGSDEQVKNKIAGNLVLLFSRHNVNMDVLHLTILEALCVGTSGDSLELIFEHMVHLFLVRFQVFPDTHVAYLQGCLLRVIRSAFAHKRTILRNFVCDNDVIGSLAICLHNNMDVSTNKHLAGMCVLSEIVWISHQFDMVSIERTLQCLMQCMNRIPLLPNVDIYILVIRQILLRRTRRISSDLLNQILHTMISPSFPRGVETIMTVIDPMVKSQRHSLDLPSCQALVRYMLSCLIDPDLNINTWVQCLGVLRTFIHQLNRANIITVLEHGKTFVVAMEQWNLDPHHTAQIMYIFRFVVCRLSVCKDIVVDRLHDSGFVNHIRRKMQMCDLAPGSSGKAMNISTMRAADILVVHDILTGFQDGVDLVLFCSKIICQHHANKKLVADVMRVIMRTLKRFEARGTFDDTIKRQVLMCILTSSSRLDPIVSLYGIFLIKFLCVSEEGVYRHDSCSQHKEVMKEIVSFCNCVLSSIYAVEMSAACIWRNRETLTNCIDILLSIYKDSLFCAMQRTNSLWKREFEYTADLVTSIQISLNKSHGGQQNNSLSNTLCMFSDHYRRASSERQNPV